ncbi:RagB/SusD family nutrient uptake outer membrane protein [Chryseolinea lacunae]|uniref:RagB/SusD family nutrient uptake outer membrane protein n=1 Tax=Chryseolinea lacunae TaxID=2801331 RepID=A0ABS1KYH9_9BACT|nr:RagB/SusD family nutrient uptake outer membrane protein [Chryseolinea lacunae]MBL0744509.1 RagB/SusD family nutrient uptake outer membrane protein [Chryseolinea lacunae]
MKKIIAICFVALVFQSCADMLEEKNKSNAVPDYFNTIPGFEDAVKGAYSFMRSFYATERGMSLTVFGTDEYTNGSDGSFKFVNQYTSQFDSRTSILSELWTDFYRGINTANTAIDRADKIVGLDAAVKTTRVAEAKFLRAQFYFILVQLYGPVPLTLNETVTASTEAHRAPVPDIYDAIVADLEFAIANLPATQPNWGRATKPAAQHLLSRVHLTRATVDPTATPQEEYQKAADLSNEVLTKYSFKLLSDYAKVFEQGSGEINEEVIWSVQYTSDPLTNGGGNNAHVFFLMEYDVQPGMQRDIANGRPFKRFKPTNYTLGLYDRAKDSRYDKNFKQVFYCNKPGTYTINGKSVTLATGDTTMWLPGVELAPEVIAAKNFQVITPSKYTEKLFPSLRKYLDPLRPDVTTFEGSRDFLAFRLAETYLIRAEALLMLGQPGSAALINTVRRRAAFAGKEADMEIADADVTLDFILDERSRELLGEQHRWFDLVRTKKLLERVKLYNAQAKDNIKETSTVRPIPQDQIDRTSNSDGSLFLQNPGY